jgi:hypothetical protein
LISIRFSLSVNGKNWNFALMKSTASFSLWFSLSFHWLYPVMLCLRSFIIFLLGTIVSPISTFYFVCSLPSSPMLVTAYNIWGQIIYFAIDLFFWGAFIKVLSILLISFSLVFLFVIFLLPQDSRLFPLPPRPLEEPKRLPLPKTWCRSNQTTSFHHARISPCPRFLHNHFIESSWPPFWLAGSSLVPRPPHPCLSLCFSSTATALSHTGFSHFPTNLYLSSFGFFFFLFVS